MPRLADFSLIIFDLDGVLVRTDRVHRLAWEDLWRRLDLAAPDYSSIAGQTTRQTIETLTASRRPSPEEIAGWVDFKQERARSYLQSEAVGFADTLPVLTALSEKRFTLALGTGASRRRTDESLARLGISAFFSIVVTAEDVQRGKPDPEVFRTVLSRAARGTEETLIVEDSVLGLQAALGSGAWAVSVRDGVSSDHDRFLGALDDLRSLLRL